MLDNLRDQSSSSPFFQEEIPDAAPIETFAAPAHAPKANLIFGMTPVQRFIVATMLFFMVCIVGTMFLIVLGKIAI
jgi:hypothetical protein